MTKSKPKADAAETPPENTGLPIPAPETPVGEGADTQPALAPDGTPPSGEAKAEAEAAAAAEPPALNLATLSHLAATIDMLNTTGHRLGLVDELKDLYGAEVTDIEGEGVTVEIEGVTGAASDCLETALTNWANAARRAVTRAGT